MVVFLGHLYLFFGDSAYRLAAYILRPDGIIMSLFFMLSGFAITWSHPSHRTAGTFWRNRFARIYPAYLTTWVIGCSLSAAEAGRFAFLPSLTGLGLLQSWVPKESYYFGGNAVAWSLSADVLMYALFPLSIVWFQRHAKVQPLCMAFLLIVTVAIDAAAHHVIQGPTTFGSWVWYIFPLKRMTDFWTGMVLALMIRSNRLPKIRFGVASTACIATYAAAVLTHTFAGDDAWTTIPFAALLVAGAQRDLGNKPTFCARPRIVRASRLTYAFYLVHQLVMRAVALTHHGPYVGWGAIGFTAVTIPLTVLFALLLHVYVEHPLERRLRTRAAPSASVQHSLLIDSGSLPAVRSE